MLVVLGGLSVRFCRVVHVAPASSEVATCPLKHATSRVALTAKMADAAGQATSPAVMVWTAAVVHDAPLSAERKMAPLLMTHQSPADGEQSDEGPVVVVRVSVPTLTGPAKVVPPSSECHVLAAPPPPLWPNTRTLAPTASSPTGAPTAEPGKAICVHTDVSGSVSTVSEYVM